MNEALLVRHAFDVPDAVVRRVAAERVVDDLSNYLERAAAERAAGERAVEVRAAAERAAAERAATERAQLSQAAVLPTPKLAPHLNSSGAARGWAVAGGWTPSFEALVSGMLAARPAAGYTAVGTTCGGGARSSSTRYACRAYVAEKQPATIPFSGWRSSPAKPSSMRVRLQRKAPMTTRSTCSGNCAAQPRRHKILCETFSKALARSQSRMRKTFSI